MCTAITPNPTSTATLDDALQRFIGHVIPRFRRLGRLPTRALDRSGGPLASLRFSPYAYRRCARELEQLLAGAAPYDDPIARYACFTWMAQPWEDVSRCLSLEQGA
jgi:hypothetical protein